MATCATLYAGGGLADIGLKQAGLTPIWAVEYDAAIAEVYAANHGPHVIVGDVRAVDFSTLEAPDLLWASPPCPNFSVAKTGRGETEADLDMARAVVRALETLRPRCFILENVEGYAASKSYRLICDALLSLDYWSDAEVVNAADLGVPQTRRRLILRARAGGWMQPSRPWPAPRPWVGWYSAIEDLIPELPESQFAPWQLKRLPAEIRESTLTWGLEQTARDVTTRQISEPAPTVTRNAMRRDSALPRALIVGGSNTSDGKAAEGVGVSEADEPVRAVPADITPTRYRAVLYQGLRHDFSDSRKHREQEEPAATVTTMYRPSHEPRAVLVQGENASRDLTLRDGDEPLYTIGADNRAAHRAALPSGRVVAMTPRALARFMGVPDDYRLPERKALACRVLGNGVCPEVARVAALTIL